MTSLKYYTYAYLREDGTPYYIGKGSGRRIYVKGGRPCGVPKDKSRIIFLKQNLTEEEAFRHEKYMIDVFGRIDLGTGILRNRTDGGEGTCGRIKTKEEIGKISERMQGKNNPMYGKKLTEEQKRNLSEKMSGENNPFYGKKHTEEFKKSRCGSGNPMYGKKNPKQSEWMCKRMSGENSPSAKTFVLTDPTGVEFVVIGGLVAFCMDNGISPGCMKSAIRRGQTGPRPSNGWSIKRS